MAYDQQLIVHHFTKILHLQEDIFYCKQLCIIYTFETKLVNVQGHKIKGKVGLNSSA